MRILLVGAPAGLVLEHVKRENLVFNLVESVEVSMQGREIQKAIWHVIILNT